MLCSACERRGAPAPTVAPEAAPAASPSAAPEASAAPAARGVDAAAPEPPFAGTVGVTQQKKKLNESVILKSVRSARHPGFDRVVLEFEGRELPSYHVEYVDRPIRRCGSGQVVEVAGDGWLRLRLDPAAAHDEQGRATVAERDRQRKLRLGVLRELVLTCDYEGYVVWVLGVASPNRYRVLELAHPPRLVVDVRHR